MDVTQEADHRNVITFPQVALSQKRSPHDTPGKDIAAMYPEDGLAALSARARAAAESVPGIT